LSLLFSPLPSIFIKKERAAFIRAAVYLLMVPCAVSLALYSSEALAASVTIGWDSNSEPDLEGYVVYRNVGAPGPPYNHSDTLPEDDLADPLHPRATFTGLKEGNEYYIALTAYNTVGEESDFSDDVCVEVVNGVVQACGANVAPTPAASTSASSGGNSGSGGSSSSCFVSTLSGETSTFSKSPAGSISRSRAMTLLFSGLFLIIAAGRKKRKDRCSLSVVRSRKTN
jgi:hypothetical protein